VKRGELVFDNDNQMYGIILTWTVIGPQADTFWEILYSDGSIDGAFEYDLEKISENR